MNLVRRLRRHLSFANVVACLALFVALGGSAYAATTINGNSIVKHSIGGGKLKNETISNKQIKKGTLNSSVIDVSSLGTVPSAQTAATAGSANTANTANTATKAGSADNATRADSAGTATSAETATRATSAETAERANSADHATSADSATNADHATTANSANEAAHAASADAATNATHATDADTLGGETAGQLTVSCPAATELFGGMCWEESPRPTAFWIVAAKECGERGGRLPSVSELVAYILQPGTQVTEQTWSADIADVTVAGEQVVTSDETGREVLGGASAKHGYRCLFYRAN